MFLDHFICIGKRYHLRQAHKSNLQRSIHPGVSLMEIEKELFTHNIHIVLQSKNSYLFIVYRGEMLYGAIIAIHFLR